MAAGQPTSSAATAANGIGDRRARHRERPFAGTLSFGNALRGIDLANNGVTPERQRATEPAPTISRTSRCSWGARRHPGQPEQPAALTYQIENFINETCDPSGNGKGQIHNGIDSAATNSDGFATLPFFPIGRGDLVTATARSPSGDTSEFSPCVLSASAHRAHRQRRSRSERHWRATSFNSTAAARAIPTRIR